MEDGCLQGGTFPYYLQAPASAFDLSQLAAVDPFNKKILCPLVERRAVGRHRQGNISTSWLTVSGERPSQSAIRLLVPRLTYDNLNIILCLFLS